MLGGRSDIVVPNRFLTAQQYLDTILQSIVRRFASPFIRNSHLMHENARPHVTRIVTNLLTTEGIAVLSWTVHTQHPQKINL